MHVYVWPIYIYIILIIRYCVLMFIVFFAFGEVSHTLFPCCAPSCLLLTEPTCSLKMTKTDGNNERKTFFQWNWDMVEKEQIKQIGNTIQL